MRAILLKLSILAQNGPGDDLPQPTDIGRTAMRLLPLAIVGRGAAFAVPAVIAGLYGAGAMTDAFFYAQAAPAFLFVVVSNAIGTTSVPVFAKIQRDDPGSLPSAIGSATLAGTAMSALGGAVMLPLLWAALPHISRFDTDQQARVVGFTAAMLPFSVLLGGSAVLKSACEVQGRFVTTTISPLFRAIVAVSTIWLLMEPLGVWALPLAYLAAQITEVAWFGATLARAGGIPVPTWPLDPRIRGAVLAAAPVIGGEAMVATNVAVDKAFAGLLPEGAVTLLEYADRARLVPQILADAVLLPVALAAWSAVLARGDRAGYAIQLDRGLRQVAAGAAPILAALYLGRFPLIAAMFGHGELTGAQVEEVAIAFGCFLPGLWSMFLGAMAMRAHVAEGRLRVVFVLGMVSVASNAVLNRLLLPWGIAGLATASAIVWVIVPLGYLGALRPTLAGVSRPGPWAAALGAAAASAILAVGIGSGEGIAAPRTFLDPALWLGWLGCGGLLALGWRATSGEGR